MKQKFLKIAFFVITGSAALLGCQRFDPVNNTQNHQLIYDQNLIPSREAYQNCQWREISNKNTGIRLLVQECTDPNIVYIFEENKLVEKIKDVPESRHTGIIVFNKEANKSPEQTLQERFLDQLPEQCEIKEIKQESPIKRNFVITSSSNTNINGCGEYSSLENTKYFEFQEQNPNKFILVNLTQDFQNFDQENIFILPEL